ncbi:hypothetical protein G7066_09035 [Leucobacter coleopterorum]|uniref:Uncharacterized protein n=1 Tax=Leucobacter coleopterorum TaxID=2714933 RepID=A0ABX6JWN9_9MICO|nr:hypothetical protein [Leucobacter coleopterorum]QIM18715.1 hypothetical protein G7066_09035 [Leucobacter coleopterorum]
MLITNTGSTPLTLSYTGVSSSAGTSAEEAFSGALRMGALARESESCQKTDFELANLVKLQAVGSEAPFDVISGEDPLAPGDSRFLCMAVALSADVPPEAQGQKATFLIKVRADQYRRAA